MLASHSSSNRTYNSFTAHAKPSPIARLREFMFSRLKDPENPSATGTGISELVAFAETLVTTPNSTDLPGFSFRDDATEAAEIQKNKLALSCAQIVLEILARNASSQKFSLREIAGESATLTYEPWPSSRHTGSPNSLTNTEPITIRIKECESANVLMLTFSTANQPDTHILFYDGSVAKTLPDSERRQRVRCGQLAIRDSIDRFPRSLANMIRAERAIDSSAIDDEHDSDEYAPCAPDPGRGRGRPKRSNGGKSQQNTGKRSKRAEEQEAQRQYSQDELARRYVSENLLYAALVEAGCPGIPRTCESSTEVVDIEVIGQKALLVYQLLTKKAAVNLQDPSTTAAALCLNMHGLFFDEELYLTFLKQRWFGVWTTDLNDKSRDLEMDIANGKPTPAAATGSHGNSYLEYEEDRDSYVFFKTRLSGSWQGMVTEKILEEFDQTSANKIKEGAVVAIGLRIYTELIINSVPKCLQEELRGEVGRLQLRANNTQVSQSLKALGPVAAAVIQLGRRLFNEAKEDATNSIPACERITLRTFLLAIKAAGNFNDTKFNDIISCARPGARSYSHRITNYFNGEAGLTSEEIDVLIAALRQHAPQIPSEFFDQLARS